MCTLIHCHILYVRNKIQVLPSYNTSYHYSSKSCLPHLLKSSNPHILNISPPLNMKPRWFKDHVAYTMAKYGMSMCVLGMAEEFRSEGVAVNALWPRTGELGYFSLYLGWIICANIPIYIYLYIVYIHNIYILHCTVLYHLLYIVLFILHCTDI